MSAFDDALKQVLKDAVLCNPVYHSGYNCYSGTPPLYDYNGEWFKEPLGVVWYHPRTNNVFVVIDPQHTVKPLRSSVADPLKEGVMAYYSVEDTPIFVPPEDRWEWKIVEEDPIEAPELPVKKVTKPPRKPAKSKPKKKLVDNLLADVPSLL